MVMTQYGYEYTPLQMAYGPPDIQMFDYLYPRTHANPSKTTDQFVSHTWAVKNNSTTTTGTARLLVLEGTVIKATGVNVSIGPTLQVNLIVTLTPLTGFSVGVHSMQLLMEDITPGFPSAVIATHNYTLTISLAPPLLSAVGDPTIV